MLQISSNHILTKQNYAAMSLRSFEAIYVTGQTLYYSADNHNTTADKWWL